MFRTESSIGKIDVSGLPALIPLYIDDLTTRCTVRTVRNAATLFLPFQQWFGGYAAERDYMLDAGDFAQYRTWLLNDHVTRFGKNPTPNSASKYLQRLRHLLRWAHETGRCDRNITGWIPQIPQTPRRARPVNVDGITRMLAVASLGQQRLVLRDRCVLALMAGTGARREEIANIRIENIDFYGSNYGSVFLEVTKNNRPRTVLFGLGTALFLSPYLESLHSDHGQLFNVEAPALWKVVNRLAARAGVGDISPHDIRKFFSLHWMENWGRNDGWAKLCLQAQLGHSGGDVTERHYLHLSLAQVRERYVSPMETIAELLRLGE